MNLSQRQFSLLVDAVITHESAWNEKAVSPAGAQGLMQLMPATGKEQAMLLGLHAYEPFNPIQNRFVGSSYLLKLIQRYNSIKLALAAYNWGMGNVSRHLNDEREKLGTGFLGSDKFCLVEPHLPEETHYYVDRVFMTYNRFLNDVIFNPKGEGR